MKLDFTRCIKQPFSGSNWFFNVLIGAGLAMVGILAGPFGLLGTVVKVLVTAFSAGYIANVMSSTVTSEANSNLPDWIDNPVQMLLKGLLLSMGVAVWVLLISVIGGLLTIPFAAVAANGAVVASPAMIIIMAVLSLITVPFIGIMMVHFAAEDRIMAFLQVGQFFSRVRSRPISMIVATLSTMALFTVAGIVSSLVLGLLAVFPIAGVIIGSVIGFIVQLMIANLWAQVYRG